MKRYLSSQERRARTVEAVISLSASRDPATITTADIAKQMQVTQGALFRHFPTKDAMWESVVAWVAERVMVCIEDAADSADDPLEGLEAMFMAHARFISEHPGVPRLLMGQLQHPSPTPASLAVRRLLDAYQKRLSMVLEKAREEDRLRLDLSLEAAAAQFIGSLQGLVLQALVSNDVERIADKASGAFDIYFNGISRSGEVAT
ncbi:MAG: TetR/AcrR family transcriptional regulator [Proteobacteria bacterium]|nr:MAG: TetR/AcrR family transcriptional regulator [Pseudomonadota bacterium]